MKKTTPEELINYGIHFGHKSQKVHPRSKKYIYKIDNGVSIIDLYKTAEELQKAKEFLFNLGKEGKNLLVIATKKQARPIVKQICIDNNINYLTNKWVAGFATNFEEIHKNVKRIGDMKKEKEEGKWNVFPKHEITKLDKKLVKLLKIYEGVENMTKLPDAFFIIDLKKENNAALEANMKKIPVVAVADTNVNPEIVTYPVPGNDDALTSIKFLAEDILGAYIEGRSKQVKVEKVA
jgi:small subunit ribosomal protein S2